MYFFNVTDFNILFAAALIEASESLFPINAL